MNDYNLQRLKIFTFLILSYCNYNNAWSQNPSFQAITTNNGLSQNSVTSIVQDSFGFLWIATQDGLNKYDGTNFTKFEVYFSDITQENFSRIGKIYLDSSNRLWRLTSDGFVAYYDDLSESFVYIYTIPNSSIILEKEENKFWVGSHTDGLFLLELQGNTSILTQVLPERAIYNIISSDENLYLASNKGVNKYNITTTESISLFSSLIDYHISDILQTSNSTLLISTFNNGLYNSTHEGPIKKIDELPHNLRIQDLLLDHDMKVWIATYNDGVFIMRNGTITHLIHNPPTQNQISYNDILCIFEDQEKNIWLGTDGGGLLLNKSNQKPIYSITNRDIPNTMAVDVTRSISKDKEGNLWIGTSGKGLTKVDRNKTNLQYYSKTKPCPFYIPNQRIMSLFHDERDRLWIGIQEGGLLSYDSDTKEILEVNKNLPAKTIWNISAKSKEHLWLCT